MGEWGEEKSGWGERREEGNEDPKPVMMKVPLALDGCRRAEGEGGGG